MRKYLALAGLLLLVAGTATAQDFPRVETAPGFSYVHNSAVLGGSQSFNCAGGGGTIALNLTSMFGVAADFSGCKAFGLDNTYGVGSKVSGSEFTYVFGPRITFSRISKFHPFAELNFGGERLGLSCNNGDVGNACGSSAIPAHLPVVPTFRFNPTATSGSVNAFAMTVGGGFDIQVNKKIAIRLVQAEYLYTRFGNSCAFPICTQNNNQNSFRLKSGIVISWGGNK